jgi:predicted DNA-binding protein
MYGGETRITSYRLPVELLDRINRKCNEFQLTRTMLVRTILETAIMDADQLRERYRREAAMRAWFKNGADEDKYPPKMEKWSDDDAL